MEPLSVLFVFSWAATKWCASCADSCEGRRDCVVGVFAAGVDAFVEVGEEAEESERMRGW